MRKTPLLAAGGVAALAVLSLEIRTAPAETPPLDPAVARALDPLFAANSLCGPSGANGFASRRALFVRAAGAYAQAAGLEDGGYAPASPGLGRSHLDITTASPEAQARFDEGLRWAAGFNHGAAIEAFRAAQAADPDCAMCYWGEAWALGPNINASMPDDAYPRAWEAVQRGVALSDGASEIERALIDALTVRYAETAPADRSSLDVAFAEAMNDVADRFPDHDELQAMAVEAGMDTQPWDYWQADGRTPKGFAGRNLQRLETVLARNPDHAPSIHLYIHTTEASTDPWRAEPYADRLAVLAPAAGHLVHMPAHTYYRIGRFADSIDTNLDAIVADEAFLDEAGDAASPIYRFGYYPHNLHFVLTSAQRAGDTATIAAFGPKLDASIPMEMASVEAFVLPIKAAPILARAQYDDPAALLAEPIPDGLPPYLEAAWIYAHGEAAARAGDTTRARAEADRLAGIAATADFSDMTASNVPGPDLVQLMRLTVLGRAAMADEDWESAVGYFEAATEIHDSIVYMEPPYWHTPARQSFAAALAMDGQYARAEQEFYRTLVEYPDNAFAYWGLAQSRRMRGDEAGAELAMQRFRAGWLGDEDALSMERL